MGVEIERKFLVVGDDWKTSDPCHFCQGYLCRDRQRTVRVRIAGESAQLTIKGESVDGVRPEFEYAIPPGDARELLELCDLPPVIKYRHKIEVHGLVWEVDEFLDGNQGLVLAEVELTARDQPVVLPNWVGEEVTNDARYQNSYLARHPFGGWV